MDNTPLQTLQELDDIEIAKSMECSIEHINKIINIKQTKIHIIAQNIRSIYANFVDFEITLSQLKFGIDIIVFSECRLNFNKPIPLLHNYTSYHTTYKQNQNDGVVVYIRNDHQAKVIEIKLTHASCLEITTHDFKILAIYRSPSIADATDFINSLTSHLYSITTKHSIIITGDLNINIIQREPKTTYERNNMQHYLTSLSTYGILPGHTCPTREYSCLDHFMLKINRSKTSALIAILNTTVTDHQTVLLSLSNFTPPSSCPITKTVIDYENALHELKLSNIAELFLLTDPNEITNLLISKITTALTKHTKILTKSRSKRIIKPYITNGILRCIMNRNYLQKQLSSDPKNKILSITYRRYRNYCNSLIKKNKRKYEREKLARSCKNNRTLWNTINEITQFKRMKTPNTKLLDIALTPTQSVNSVNDFFVNIGSDLAGKIIANNFVKCPSLLPGATNSQVCSFVLLDTDPYEIEHILMNIDSNSAPGWDNIPTNFLKKSKEILVPVICHLANNCFAQGVFPGALKKSIITPVYKGGGRDDVNNYRPISVLTSISKILEKLINTRLVNYLNKYNILAKTQFGFRKSLSTEDAIATLTSLIVENLDNAQKCLAIFLDLKKAFDTVSAPILVQKLENIGIRGTPLALLQDYLNERTQRTKIGSYMSHDVDVVFGVPQGSVLGPTLFLIYINDLCNMDMDMGSVVSYADDTALVFSGNTWADVYKYSEVGLAKVSEWLNKNLLTLNTIKTNYISFSIRNSSQPDPEYRIKIHSCGTQCSRVCNCPTISKVDKIKYLGIMVDQNLSWNHHINLVSTRVRKLIWIFKNLRYVATKELLIKVYTALAQSVMVYCIPIWGGSSKTKLLELERAQRTLLKVIHFKKYRFPTTELYKISDVLTARKLYILNCIVKLHKANGFDPQILRKRRKDIVLPYQIVSTTFARQQYKRQSSYLYNKINKVLNIYPLNSYECKTSLSMWLKSLNYEDTERLLEVLE